MPVRLWIGWLRETWQSVGDEDLLREGEAFWRIVRGDTSVPSRRMSKHKAPETLKSLLCCRDRKKASVAWFLALGVGGEVKRKMTYAKPLKAMGRNLSLILVAVSSTWTVLIWGMTLIFTAEKLCCVDNKLCAYRYGSWKITLHGPGERVVT